MPPPKGYKLDAPTGLPHESKDAIVPPELDRLKGTLGVNVVEGKPFKGYGGKEAIASVAEGEPHQIEVNNSGKWNQAPKQELSHEMTHLAMNQMAGPIRNAIPLDNPNKPYDISDVDQLRAKGLKIWQLPQEKAARIVQQYSADPASRQRLQAWIDDFKSAPLSVMQPTGPNDKTINRNPRPPIPPVESYTSPSALLAEAKKRNPNAQVKHPSETMAIPKPKGLVEAGNLPIWNRPTVQNADGSHSSEYSTSFADDKGREVLVPTVVNGKFLTPDGKKPKEGSKEEEAMFKAAWQHYLNTGENLGKFDNPKDADAYANILHNRGNKK